MVRGRPNDNKSKARAEEVAGFCAVAPVVDNMQATKWMKLVSNATTLVSTALFGLSIHDGAATPEARDLMLRSGQEAFDVGHAVGHPVLPIFGLTASGRRPFEPRRRSAARDAAQRVHAALHQDHSPQDWMKGRHSEVNDLNGTVVAEAQLLGRRAPVNAAIVEMASRSKAGG